MANVARVRVEAKRLPHNASGKERMDNLQRLLKVFKRQCNEYGVLQSFRDHEFFQRKCDLRRRKDAMRKMAARQEFKDPAERNKTDV